MQWMQEPGKAEAWLILKRLIHATAKMGSKKTSHIVNNQNTLYALPLPQSNGVQFAFTAINLCMQSTDYMLITQCILS